MNNKEVGVLLLTTPFRPNVGGVETHLDDLITQATSKGFKFWVITYQPLITKAWGKIVEKDEGFIAYRIPWLRFNLFLRLEKYPLLEFIYLFPALFIFGVVFLIFNFQKIKVIHAQGLIAGAVGIFLGKVFSKPTIISTHSIYHFKKYGLYRSFIKYLFKSSKQILTLSKQSYDEVLNLGVDKSQVSQFTYWVDQRVFYPKEKKAARIELNITSDKFVVLFVGRLVEVKGIKELIQAAVKLPRITFIIIGDGPLATYVQQISDKNPNIQFMGKIVNRELVVYYSAADVLIVPSTHEEGFGRVILEALSCGLPVIGANRGGIKEILNPDIGILIDITPENITRALKKVKNNRVLLKKMQKKAVIYAKKSFNDKNIDQIIRYYE